jgi:hypothetical protein
MISSAAQPRGVPTDPGAWPMDLSKLFKMVSPAKHHSHGHSSSGHRRRHSSSGHRRRHDSSSGHGYRRHRSRSSSSRGHYRRRSHS